jgi:hypothetical protein
MVMTEAGRPLVTGGVALALFALHQLPFFEADMRGQCLMPGGVLYDVELQRFATGVFRHWSGVHLYWTAASLVAKGVYLVRAPMHRGRVAVSPVARDWTQQEGLLCV